MVKAEKKSTRKSSEAEVEEQKVVEEELYESDLVKLKKENQKVMSKKVKEIDSLVKQNIDQKQVSQCVKALQKYFESKHAKDKKKQLLAEEDSAIHLSWTLEKVPEKQTPRPLQVNVAKPFNSKKFDTRVCIIVKDPESYFRMQIEKLDIPCIAEVIGFDRLKRDFHQFKDKRQLQRDYDIFLADIRIYKMLPELLGKDFYSKKSFPCPIKVHGLGSNEELAAQLNSASESAYFMAGNGPNYSLRIGRVSQDSKDIAKNVESALGQALGYVTCWDNLGFDHVSQMSLRVGDSIELPFYNHFDQRDVDAYMAKK